MRITRFATKRERGQMVRMNREEALRLVRSLMNQIIEGSPNSGRDEVYCTVEGDGTPHSEYFSISVHE